MEVGSIICESLLFTFCVFCEFSTMAEAKFDLKLIPEFDGSTPVVDWVERVELTCNLCEVKKIHTVIPLRLSGGALSVYQQLSPAEKANLNAVKGALYKAFAMDPCTAYEKFASRKLLPGETVDVFFASLKKLALLFGGGISERAYAYAFVAGLPTRVKQLLRASTNISATTIEHLLERARAIIRDEEDLGEPVVMAAQTGPNSIEGIPSPSPATGGRCFRCGRRDHFVRNCPDKGRGRVRCFQCGGFGHLAQHCAGNVPGDRTSAPLRSPDKM